MSNHDMIMQVRELIERHFDAYEISHKLHIDIDLVYSVLETFQKVIS